MIRPFNSFEEFEETYKDYKDIFFIRLCVKSLSKRKHWWSLKKTVEETASYYELVPVNVKCLCYGIKEVDVQVIIDNCYYRIEPTRLYHY